MIRETSALLTFHVLLLKNKLPKDAVRSVAFGQRSMNDECMAFARKPPTKKVVFAFAFVASERLREQEKNLLRGES